MKIALIIALALTLAGCGDDAITYTSSKKPEMIMIAVNDRGEVFMSNHDSTLSFDDFAKAVSELENDENSYGYVIQSAASDDSDAKRVKKLLLENGVKERNIAVSSPRP
ncbi:hypothetical protein [Gilvimarinus xylanilyticus]|uniref:Uncharacterized protein n=1 Tax=Gilvimarinus xylanilyticus TaxID=2944139 RepID=A0A9X2HXH2_9GAMM|nr:hypothetical protein [Gilvimarinus xylanilyticus]MCP8899449.1 hypothetical protein [Gilvimarinus xylanilyticus]